MNALQTICSLSNNLFFALAGLIGISLIVAFMNLAIFYFVKFSI